MRLDAVSKLTRILVATRNPVPLLLDYAGLKRHPYRVANRNALVLELRPKVGDRFGFYEVMLRNDYLSGGQSLCPGDTVIDIGANVGCFTLLAASRVGPTGRVIAVEPEPSNFEQLRRNVALNHATNVTARRVAVGGYQGTVTLHTTAASALYGSIYTDVNRIELASESQSVPMITLADLMRQEAIEHCQYLKLDCEGAEHDIVSSMAADVAKRIDQITLELHRIEGRDPTLIEPKLQGLGFGLVDRQRVHYYRRAGP